MYLNECICLMISNNVNDVNNNDDFLFLLIVKTSENEECEDVVDTLHYHYIRIVLCIIMTYVTLI